MGTCVVKMNTGKALLVIADDYGEIWCPLSCIHDDSYLYCKSKEGDVDELILKTWFAEQKGWV